MGIEKKDLEGVGPQRNIEALYRVMVALGMGGTYQTFYNRINKPKLHQPVAARGKDGLWRLNADVAWEICNGADGKPLNPSRKTAQMENKAARLMDAKVRRAEALAQKEDRLERQARGELVPRAEIALMAVYKAAALQQAFVREIEKEAEGLVVLVGGDPARAHALAAELKRRLRQHLAAVYADGPLRITVDPAQAAPQDDEQSAP